MDIPTLDISLFKTILHGPFAAVRVACEVDVANGRALTPRPRFAPNPPS
jgi:hypothetical protein